MSNFILNFICKNEAHVIERMLNSNLGVVDVIVANDTGSSDNTIEIIKKWGADNNVPTFVFERTFDNFQNSRNFAMEKAIEVAKELNMNLDDTFGYWIDCDEILNINKSIFNRNLDKDFYMIETIIRTTKYTRNTFFKLSKKFRWYGVVHEFIVCDEPVLSDLIKGLSVTVFFDGGSWQGNIAEKYKNHALTLEKYIDSDRTDPRWIFYTAQSYEDSARTDNRDENDERLRRSYIYYNERASRMDGHAEEIFFSQFKIGQVKLKLEESWEVCKAELLKAYNLDPIRGEPIKAIIDYYMNTKNWNSAYIYTSFAMKMYSGKSPYPNRLLFVDDSLYMWKFIESHAIVCFYTGRKQESSNTYKQLLSIMESQPHLFNENDINKINSNKKYFL